MFENACVTLEVVDLTRALRFWTETLGFASRFQRGDWAEVSLGAFRVALHRRENAVIASGMSIGLGAGHDLETLAEQLKARGIAVGAIEEDAEVGVRLLHFQDPEGHRLYAWTLKTEPESPSAP
jgi:catechol 2,3-dioxygenase-like lactoylglutathione lyase family enzyme